MQEDTNDVVDDDEEYEEGEQAEEINSPKYNASDDEAAPRPSMSLLRNYHDKKKFLYQINMAEEERGKYFYDNYPNKKLLPYVSPQSKQEKVSL